MPSFALALTALTIVICMACSKFKLEAPHLWFEEGFRDSPRSSDAKLALKRLGVPRSPLALAKVSPAGHQEPRRERRSRQRLQRPLRQNRRKSQAENQRLQAQHKPRKPSLRPLRKSRSRPPATTRWFRRELMKFCGGLMPLIPASSAPCITSAHGSCWCRPSFPRSAPMRG